MASGNNDSPWAHWMLTRICQKARLPRAGGAVGRCCGGSGLPVHGGDMTNAFVATGPPATTPNVRLHMGFCLFGTGGNRRKACFGCGMLVPAGRSCGFDVHHGKRNAGSVLGRTNGRCSFRAHQSSVWPEPAARGRARCP